MPQYRITSIEAAEGFISEFFRSGQSRKEFCQKQGIKVSTFNWWVKRHNDAKERKHKFTNNKETSFVQIASTATPPLIGHQESELDIDLQNGMRIRWRGNEIPSSFYRLLTTLNSGAAQ